MDSNSPSYVWITLITSVLEGMGALVAISAAIIIFINRNTISSSIGLFRLYSWRREIEKELYRIEKKIDKYNPTGNTGPSVLDLKNEIEILNSFIRTLKEISGKDLKEEIELLSIASGSNDPSEIISGLKGVLTTIKYGQFMGKV